jgi:AcrR family transcriptional regulator
MVPVPKQEGVRKRRNRESEVIEAAIDVFWQKGYSAASIQEVADQVGVLKGSLYYYIESKEHLLFRIVDEVHRQSTEILEEVQTLDVPAIERLRVYIERHVEWYLRNVKEVSVFFREWRHLTGEHLETVIQRRRGYDRAIRDLITAAKKEGDLGDGVDTKYAALYMLAAVNAVPDWYSAGGRDSPKLIAAAFADMTVGMLDGTRAAVRRPVRRRRAA